MASGKGGVGKSTVSANLALALAAEGHTVGLLDADVYGPSQGLMMGVSEETQPEVADDLLQPISVHGIQVMSMSFVTSDRTPAIWRGPMASSALQQLLTQTNWQNVDYLIVDMPPGTGDIQLTMAQNVPLSGAIIVTTPQDIARLDACKGIEMFRKVEVPLLGIIENMSHFICDGCDKKHYIFKSGGGNALAEKFKIPFLTEIPLIGGVVDGGDKGVPVIMSDPSSSATKSNSTRYFKT